jgi:glycosyltransferase involved in cell wall biosynthesis
MTVETAVRPAAALARRLARVRGILDPRGRGPDPDEDSLFDSLAPLVSSVSDARGSGPVWLLLVALTGAMPDQTLVHAVRRGLAIRTPEVAVPWMLTMTTALAAKHGTAGADLRIVTDRPLVDVDLTAQTDLVTGIQRVVRGVAARWTEQHDLELVVWGARESAYRALSSHERGRLVEGAEVAAFVGDRGPVAGFSTETEIVVPWGVPVLVTEVPLGRRNDRLAALAELTHNSVRLVGYDCIPVASPETVNSGEMEKFGPYLELVKHADRLAAISHTTAREFEGFNRALNAQGLPGPEVVACPLPHTISLVGASPAPHPPDRAVVLTVGSLGRRKNQVALVEAAELLWRDGVDFELRLLGHPLPERSPLWQLIRELQKLGRPLTVEKGVSDTRIAESLAEARCLVFPSLHEGFGLPVVEALTQQIPVITSDFGSLREVAEGQGGLLVDPEDVDQLATAVRALVTDNALHSRLAAEAAARPVRTWSHYADELWEVLTA